MVPHSRLGLACVAGVKRGRGKLGAREHVGRARVSRPNSLLFRTPATQARLGPVS